jgi:DNA-directed RNA polymerase subunit H (RpoH/RPB5)
MKKAGKKTIKQEAKHTDIVTETDRRRGKVVCDMLDQRGWAILSNTSSPAYRSGVISAVKVDGELVSIYFVNVDNVTTDCVEYYISLMNEENVRHAILIYKNAITPAAAKITSDVPVVDVGEIPANSPLQKMRIELFAFRELSFNITMHIYQPKFRLLGEDEAAEFRAKHGIKHPKMNSTDPIARFYGFVAGDILEVTRSGSIGGGDSSEFVAYRIVKK